VTAEHPEGAGSGGTAPGAVAVVVSLHVKPGHEDEFLRLLAPVLDAMRHEATFVNAVLHRDPDDPTRFLLYETWAHRDDLVDVQMKRGYRAAYEARLPAILREPRRAEVWRPLRGDFAFHAASPAGSAASGTSTRDEGRGAGERRPAQR
jgi:quinol monooxygenase YgiN